MFCCNVWYGVVCYWVWCCLMFVGVRCRVVFVLVCGCFGVACLWLLLFVVGCALLVFVVHRSLFVVGLLLVVVVVCLCVVGCGCVIVFLKLLRLVVV